MDFAHKKLNGNGILDNPAEGYTVGTRLMIRDTVNKICEAEVLDVRQGPTPEIRIHYIGWPSKWDEWLGVTSNRIQHPPGSVPPRPNLGKPSFGSSMIT